MPVILDYDAARLHVICVSHQPPAHDPDPYRCSLYLRGVSISPRLTDLISRSVGFFRIFHTGQEDPTYAERLLHADAGLAVCDVLCDALRECVNKQERP